MHNKGVAILQERLRYGIGITSKSSYIMYYEMRKEYEEYIVIYELMNMENHLPDSD